MTVTNTPNGFNLNDAGRRVIVDPVTRIEGHMRCEVNIDDDNIIRNAISSGTMWRGLEVILKGRDPRDAWAFVQRICGVCTGTHALTSVRAVEDALKIKIPENANSIRNLMQLSLQVQDHLVHFYHLHALDWVNPVNALKADPVATSALQQSISPHNPKSSPGYFRDTQNRLLKFVESGQLGPFKNGYWTNPAYLLPPEADLMEVSFYGQAIILTSIAAFASMHGLVHGSEMPVAASAYAYTAGIISGTGVLHCSGLALGLIARRINAAGLIRVYGTLTSVIGAWLLFAA